MTAESMAHGFEILERLPGLVERLERLATDRPTFGLAVPVAEAAKLAGVSESTMRGWIARGIVPTIRMDAESRQLVRVAALEQALREHEQGGQAWASDSEAWGPGKTVGRKLRANR